MKIIGILGRLNTNIDNKDVIIINNNIKNIVLSYNSIPLLIPPINNTFKSTKDKLDINLLDKEKKVLNNMIDMCDGLIIPGGSYWYDYDVYTVKYAIKKDIPILGICLGMQLLASIANNEYSNIKNDTYINHKQINKKYVHNVNIIDNTKLKNILNKDSILVNSRHEYHIKNSNNYIVSANSLDGIIEAIEYKDKKFVIGLEWHPEDMVNYDIYAKKIFDEFFKYINK